jgi:TM2 domain-containing membrane protein YozV
MKCYVHPDIDAVGTCANCGKSVCSNCAVDFNGKVTCKSCIEKMTSSSASSYSGTAQAPVNRKEPIFSLALSFLGYFLFGIIGLGQIYNGQLKKGIILTLANWVLLCLIGILVWFVIGFCIIPVQLILWLYAMYDAYVVAEKINRGEPTRDWLS